MTDKKCTKKDCNNPQFNNYDWCHEHMKAEWRKREHNKRKGTPKKTSHLYTPMFFEAGQPVCFQVIDWGSGNVYEFVATATGNVTPIPEREDGQFTRMKDAWIHDGSLMAIVLRGEA